MASAESSVHVYVSSHKADFKKERHVLHSEILPIIERWCENKLIEFQSTDIQLGNFHTTDELDDIINCIESREKNGVLSLFINITCENIGHIPIENEGILLEEYKSRLKICHKEEKILEIMYSHGSTKNLFLMRNDELLPVFLDEGDLDHFIGADFLPRHIKEVACNFEKYSVEQVYKYSYESVDVDVETREVSLSLSSQFYDKVFNFLKQRIEMEFGSYESKFVESKQYQAMRESHFSFLAAESEHVIGRNDIIAKIEDYIVSGEKDVPLLLLGGPGCGKTSIMAKAADRFNAKIKNKQLSGCEDWHLFCHFVGAVPGSTELEPMLKRLLYEIRAVNESTMPPDLKSAAQFCCSQLKNQSTRPIIVMVDAVNQFDEDQQATIMSWLPRKLGSRVRCILSMINDTPQHQNIMSRESKPQELHLTPLEFHHRKAIVEEFMKKNRIQLTTDQLNTLFSRQTSENPLWLVIACEEIKLCHTRDDLDMKIASLPNGLLNLLTEVLNRFERESQSRLLVATLCLLEASKAGLLESELLQILGDENNLAPPSPFDEKEEKESSEKEATIKKKHILSKHKWEAVLKALQPFLRPFGSKTEGRMDFYHRALSKAIRTKYFEIECEDMDWQQDTYVFWHTTLANFFEHNQNVERKTEEYLYHLCKIKDHHRLASALTDWHIFDKLYSDEFSSQLLEYWRQAGGSDAMVEGYKASLHDLESTEDRNDEVIACRYEHIARIFLQAGKYTEALELTKVAIKWEEKELGNRPERMVELYSLISHIYDEKLKLNDFLSPTQLPDLKKTITYGRKSIELRSKLNSDYHKHKQAMSLMKLAFSLESWKACGGDGDLTVNDALEEGNKHIDTAIDIFKKFNDMGHYGEALMTKGVLAQRGSMEQLKYYNQAMDICLQVYGEMSLLASRLYINIGIVYEDNRDYVKAFEYFKNWGITSDAVLGPEHPKTIRAKGVLKEPRYRLVAERLKQKHNQMEQRDNENDNNEENNENTEPVLDDAAINAEVSEMPNPNFDADNENADNDMETGQSLPILDLIQSTEELQRAINELLQRTLGEIDSQQDVLSSLIGNIGANPGARAPLAHCDTEDDEDEDIERREDLNEDDL